jgi:hypothetical protein
MKEIEFVIRQEGKYYVSQCLNVLFRGLVSRRELYNI